MHRSLGYFLQIYFTKAFSRYRCIPVNFAKYLKTYFCRRRPFSSVSRPHPQNCYKYFSQPYLMVVPLQTHHAYSTLKRRGNGRFLVTSTWNTRGVFAGIFIYFEYSFWFTLNIFRVSTVDHLQEDISGIPRQLVQTEIRSNQPIVSCKTETAKNVINFIGMYLERSPFKENCKPWCQKMHSKGHHHCFFPVKTFLWISQKTLLHFTNISIRRCYSK